MSTLSQANPANPFLGAKLAQKRIPIYTAGKFILGYAEENQMRLPSFVALIAKVVIRQKDQAITRIYLKALPGEVYRFTAEDNKTCVRDRLGYRFHMERSAAYKR
ncbi:MAG: hypothetical protein NTV52_00425 [Acidobacteria bacterium]|nr:hypothetical protein [Acidobacteriota bacterium]